MTYEQQEKSIKLLKQYVKVTQHCIMEDDYCPGCEEHGDENAECSCIIEIKEFLKEIKED